MNVSVRRYRSQLYRLESWRRRFLQIKSGSSAPPSPLGSDETHAPDLTLVLPTKKTQKKKKKKGRDALRLRPNITRAYLKLLQKHKDRSA